MPFKKGHRGVSRASRRRARTPTPVEVQPPSDEEEQVEIEEAASPEQGDEDVEDAATPAQESDEVDSAENSPRPPTRRKSTGRSRSRRAAGVTPDLGQDDASDAGTPKRRRGGWRGGFRGRGGRARRGLPGPSNVTRTPVDKDGNSLEVIDDDVVLPEDSEGETKINKDGELQGDRTYRVRTFPIVGRGKRLYMLSTEPARCTGFRDSYLFFARHPHLFKIIVNDEEKKDMIDRDILPNSYKGRPIGVLTARSVFKEFGAKIVVNGKKVVDDYKVSEARARGDVEGELADPEDIVPTDRSAYNRNRYVAWHGASNVYHTDIPGTAPVGGRPVLGKRKGAITSSNWMHEHARAASDFNSALVAERRKKLDGVYDPHTNVMCYPQIMQPTHARWEQVETASQEPATKKQRLGTVNGSVEHEPSRGSDDFEGSTLEKPSSFVSRNFLVVDTHYATPPDASLPAPGPHLDYYHPALGTGSERRGLPDLSPTDLDRLPRTAREAYMYARETEKSWRGMWQGEQEDGARAKLHIGIASV